MKQISKYIFGVLIFMGLINVVSAKSVLDCKYTMNFARACKGQGREYDFHIEYHDDDTLAISSFDSIYSSEGRDGLCGSNVATQVNQTLKAAKEYIKEYNSCPTAYFEYDGSSQFTLRIAGDQTNIPKGSYGTNYKGSTSDTGNVETKMELVCEEHIKAMRNESWDVVFRFYRLGDKLKWSAADTISGVPSPSDIDNIAAVDGYGYSLDPSMVKSVYEDGYCAKDAENYKFFLECENGEPSNILLTLKKPDDSNNCSYGVKEAKYDNGLDVRRNTASSSTFTSTDGETAKFLRKVYYLFKILIPLLVIILSIVDFLKVLFLSDDKNYKEAYAKFVKRVIIGIIIFVVPALISLIIHLAGVENNTFFSILK